MAERWKPDPIPVGTVLRFADGYSFRVTAGGPMYERACIDCGGVCYAAWLYPTPRCGDCAIAKTGALAGVARLALAKRHPVAKA